MDNIIVEQKGRVALIHLNRPDKLNALSTALFTELNAAIDDAEKNDDTGAIVIIGVGRAFARRCGCQRNRAAIESRRRQPRTKSARRHVGARLPL